MPPSDLNNMLAQQANRKVAQAYQSIKRQSQQIKNQARIFENFGKGNTGAHLHGYISILNEMERALNEMHKTATHAKNAMPRNAPKNLIANVRGTYASIDKELKSTFGELAGAVGQVDNEFRNPARAVTNFGADPISMMAQPLEMFSLLTKWFVAKRKKVAENM